MYTERRTLVILLVEPWDSSCAVMDGGAGCRLKDVRNKGGALGVAVQRAKPSELNGRRGVMSITTSWVRQRNTGVCVRVLWLKGDKYKSEVGEQQRPQRFDKF